MSLFLGQLGLAIPNPDGYRYTPQVTTKLIRITLFSLSLSALVEAAPLSLKQAFDEAVKKTETIPIQEHTVKQAEERIDQIRGAVMPSISLLGSYQKQDPSAGNNAFTRDQQSARINLVQPLFRGLRDFAEWRSADQQLISQQQQLELARVILYGQVARAYYQVLQQEADLADLQTLKKLTEERTQELRGRVKIGRSRRGELLTSEAQVATLAAQIENALNQIEQARENFAALTGLEQTTQLQVDSAKLPEAVEPIDKFLTKVEARPDIGSARAQEQAAEEKIDSAWGAHLPSLDLQGNYYLKRTGIQENVKWDAAVVLSIPIFQGGTISAQVREANEIYKTQTLRLAALRRNAHREIRTAHGSLLRLISQFKALENALAAAEANYKEQTRDYRFGLVTNLDVIQALNTFQDTKRQLDQVYFSAKQAEVTLFTSVGVIP